MFDITTPDLAYEWLQEILGISGEDIIRDYILKCNKDLDCFIMFISQHSIVFWTLIRPLFRLS